jgi:hypothetical protein
MVRPLFEVQVAAVFVQKTTWLISYMCEFFDMIGEKCVSEAYE